MSVVLKRTFLNLKVELTKKYPKSVLKSESRFSKLKNFNFQSYNGAFQQQSSLQNQQGQVTINPLMKTC